MRLLVIGLVLLASSVHAQDALLKDVRTNIREVFETEAVCYRIFEAFEKTDISEHNLLHGYKGAVRMGMASHDSNLFNRMGHFSGGKKLLEHAVDHDPNNLELRFLRLTIQTNLPSILGYGGDKANDKNFVLNHLHEVHDPTIKARMKDFIAKAEEEGKL